MDCYHDARRQSGQGRSRVTLSTALRPFHHRDNQLRVPLTKSKIKNANRGCQRLALHLNGKDFMTILFHLTWNAEQTCWHSDNYGHHCFK